MEKSQKMPLNIQLFAEESKGTSPVTETDDKTQATGAEPVQKTEPKTFTQEEVNALEIKWKAKLPSKEELTEFKKWRDSQKTIEEKNAEILEENKKLKAKNLELENLSVVANAGVDSKFQKFVLSEVVSMEGEFENNLTAYLKTNTQYLVEKKNEKPDTTGVSQNGVNPQVSDTKAYLDKKYANNPYYKKQKRIGDLTQYGNDYVNEEYSGILEPNLFCDTVLIPGITYNDEYEGDVQAGAVKIYKETSSEQKDPGKPAEDFSDEGTSNELIDMLLNNAYRKSKKIYQVTENSCPYNKAEKNLSLAVTENKRDRQASGLACLVNEGTPLEDTTPLTSTTIKDKVVDLRTALRKKHVYPNVVMASVEAFAEMLKAAGKEYTPNTNDRIVTTGQVGTWLGMLWLEADALDGTAKYYDYTGVLKTVNLSEVELIMYQADTFHLADNLTMMRLKDSELFTGVKAQNELNTGFRVTNSDKVLVKKKTAVARTSAPKVKTVDTMSKAELIEYAKANEIAIDESANKDVILATIKNAISGK